MKRGPTAARSAGLLGALALLALVLVLSLAVGAKPLSLPQAWHGLVDPGVTRATPSSTRCGSRAPSSG